MILFVEVDLVQHIGDLLGVCPSENQLAGSAGDGAAIGHCCARQIAALGDKGVESGLEVLEVKSKIQDIRLPCSSSRGSDGGGGAANGATRHQFGASRGSGQPERSKKMPAIQCATRRDLLELPDRCRRVEDFDFSTGHCVGLLTS